MKRDKFIGLVLVPALLVGFVVTARWLIVPLIRDVPRLPDLQGLEPPVVEKVTRLYEAAGSNDDPAFGIEVFQGPDPAFVLGQLGWAANS